MGFNLENCEVWFERAVFGMMTLSAIVIIIRVGHTIPTVGIPSVLNACSAHSFGTLGSFRDLHFELLLPTLPLSIVVDVGLVHGIASHERRLAPPYLSVANTNCIVITFG